MKWTTQIPNEPGVYQVQLSGTYPDVLISIPRLCAINWDEKENELYDIRMLEVPSPSNPEKTCIDMTFYDSSLQKNLKIFGHLIWFLLEEDQ